MAPNARLRHHLSEAKRSLTEALRVTSAHLEPLVMEVDDLEAMKDHRDLWHATYDAFTAVQIWARHLTRDHSLAHVHLDSASLHLIMAAVALRTMGVGDRPIDSWLSIAA